VRDVQGMWRMTDEEWDEYLAASDTRYVSELICPYCKKVHGDDGIAECLTGCFSACLGLGKKAATS